MITTIRIVGQLSDQRYMYSYLIKQLQDVPNKVLLAYKGTHIKKEAFLTAVDKVAAYLHHRLNIRPGDVVTLNLPNIPQALITFYAISKCGAIASIVHPLLPVDSVIDLMKATGSRHLFCFDLAFGEHAERLISNGITPILCGAEEYLGIFKKIGYKCINHAKLRPLRRLKDKGCLRFADTLKEKRPLDAQPRLGDVAVYLHSGGTTGQPKTIALSADNFNVLSVKLEPVMDGYDRDRDVILMALPMFHGFGLGVCAHFGLCHGLKIVLMPKFSARECAELLTKEGVNFIAGVPSMFEKMMHEPSFVHSPHFKDLRYLYCGGDKMPYDLKQQFDKLLSNSGSIARLQEGYGLTETVNVVCVNNRTDNIRDCVGIPLVGNTFKIIDDNGRPLPVHRKGEICVNTETAMLGYLNDPDATAATLHTDENGQVWVHTGDYGYLDNEGRVYFLERLKRLIKISGVNVFPAAIENEVSTLPEIARCCAVEYKTEKHTTGIELAMILNDGYVLDEPLKDKIIATLSRKFMRYSMPSKFTVMQEFPLTPLGKIDYRAITRMLA